MKYIKIGNKIEASGIMLGCMRMVDVDDAKCEKIINTAIESGITVFDHADIYGKGACEEKFGKVLTANKGIRDKMLIQSKCAIGGDYYDFSRKHILDSVEGSLRRLNTDYLDILLLHRPDTLMEADEVAEAFTRLEREGKVKNFGVSNCNPWQIELLKTAVKQEIVANQLQLLITEAGIITSGLNVNMKNADSVMLDGGILEYSRIKNITIQAWSPIQYGFFEGVFVGNRDKFPTLNDNLDKMAKKYDVSPSAIAVAWILRHPANMQVIVGTMNSQRLKDVCKGADITLSREDWYRLYCSARNCVVKKKRIK